MFLVMSRRRFGADGLLGLRGSSRPGEPVSSVPSSVWLCEYELASLLSVTSDDELRRRRRRLMARAGVVVDWVGSASSTSCAVDSAPTVRPGVSSLEEGGGAELSGLVGDSGEFGAVGWSEAAMEYKLGEMSSARSTKQFYHEIAAGTVVKRS